MATAEHAITAEKPFDVESFSSSLRSAIDISALEPDKKDLPINRYYYTVGNYHFLLEEKIKAENLDKLKINQVPFMPKWHQGIVSVRGSVVPVIDMQQYVLSKTDVNMNNLDKPQKAYYLMLEYDGFSPIIFKIDALPKLVNIKPYKKIRTSKKIPKWMVQNHKNKKSTLMQVNHRMLLNELINDQ